jgi:hypothetical protein
MKFKISAPVWEISIEIYLITKAKFNHLKNKINHKFQIKKFLKSGIKKKLNYFFKVK